MQHVPLLLPHLPKGISNIEGTDFLVILEFEELVASMPSHVDENVGTIVGKQAFGSRDRCINTPWVTEKVSERHGGEGQWTHQSADE